MYLRCQLMGFLRQFSCLTTDASVMSSPETCVRCFSCLRQQVTSWYCTDVYPHVCITPITPASLAGTRFPEVRQRNYRQVIYAFLDCVICSLVCALEEVILVADQDHSSQETNAGYAAAKHVAAMSKSVVCETSYITAQHLSFGLERLSCHTKIQW